MPVRIRIEHIPKGYMDVWKSDGMQAAVDQAGQKIAAEANAGYGGEWFGYQSDMGNFTAMGFVSSKGPTGAYYQQRDRALSKAVHG